MISVRATEQRLEKEGIKTIPWYEFVQYRLRPKKSSKCTIHVNVHKLYAVHHNNTVWSLDISITISSFFGKFMLGWTRECMTGFKKINL